MLRFGILLLCVSFAHSFSVHKSSLANLTASSDIQKEPRIISGEAALPGQFPWQAAVYVTKTDVTSFCGGTIISQEWILTTADCILGALSIQVHVGSVLVTGSRQISGAQVAHHENYANVSTENNIGLIRLSEELQFDATTSAIALAEEPIGADREVVVSGWGDTSDGGTTSEHLNYVFLSTISNSDCAAIYGTLSDTVLCAVLAGTTRGICDGDGGGPLVLHVNTSPVLVGFVSFQSANGCELSYPSGFTRVGSYRSWIRKYTGI